jgi:chitinase
MAQHVKIDLKCVTPKLHKKLKQFTKLTVSKMLLDELPDFKYIHGFGLNIQKLSNEFSKRYKYPLNIQNGSDFIDNEYWNDLKGIATIEVHLNKDLKIKDCFIVA